MTTTNESPFIARQAFEKKAGKANACLDKNEYGEYISNETESAWWGYRAALADSAQQTEAPVNVPSVRLPERVIDTLMQAAGVSTYHPSGDQLEKLHEFAHGVTAEVLARLPTKPAPVEQAEAQQSDDWAEAQRICDFPAVDEVIRGFAEDQTGDNATMIVREVMRAIAKEQAK